MLVKWGSFCLNNDCQGEIVRTATYFSCDECMLFYQILQKSYVSRRYHSLFLANYLLWLIAQNTFPEGFFTLNYVPSGYQQIKLSAVGKTMFVLPRIVLKIPWQQLRYLDTHVLKDFYWQRSTLFSLSI